MVEKDAKTIHINVHVPNPSALNDTSITTEGVNKLVVTQSTSNSWKMWLEYCIENIQKCVNDILTEDFGFEKNDRLINTNFLFNGDCNDPKGYLRQYLQDTGITILGRTNVRFNFGNKILYTACPNTNSTNARKHDGSDLKVSSPAFTKPFSFLEKPPTSDDILILTHNYLQPTIETEKNIMYPANYAFPGDYIGCSINGTTNLQQIDSSNSTDHQFVAASFSN